jgi:hypothetical protein
MQTPRPSPPTWTCGFPSSAARSPARSSSPLRVTSARNSAGQGRAGKAGQGRRGAAVQARAGRHLFLPATRLPRPPPASHCCQAACKAPPLLQAPPAKQVPAPTWVCNDVKHGAGGVADQRVSCKGGAVVPRRHHISHLLFEQHRANGQPACRDKHGVRGVAAPA